MKKAWAKSNEANNNNGWQNSRQLVDGYHKKYYDELWRKIKHKIFKLVQIWLKSRLDLSTDVYTCARALPMLPYIAFDVAKNSVKLNQRQIWIFMKHQPNSEHASIFQNLIDLLKKEFSGHQYLFIREMKMCEWERMDFISWSFVLGLAIVEI